MPWIWGGPAIFRVDQVEFGYSSVYRLIPIRVKDFHVKGKQMETTKPITLVLADDHGILREGIAAFCSSRTDLKILGQSSDGAEAVDLILALKPDYAVLD